MYPHLPIPTEIAFEPVNLCNAKCFCCPYSWLGEDKNYTSKKIKYMSLHIFIIGTFSSFLNIELMLPLWLGIIISVLMPVLIILEVEKEIKRDIQKNKFG